MSAVVIPFGPWRDNDFMALCWSEDHRADVNKVVRRLTSKKAYNYAFCSIVWGNYPELTPEETASAALDGFEVLS